MNQQDHKTLVELQLVEGPNQGKVLSFSEQDTFTIGRAGNCSCVVKDDRTFSRHHMLLEVNQANVTLKDLGSLNGTKVNGVAYGGRDKSVAPEDAEPSPPIAVRDGDRIKAGRNVMVISIRGPVLCVDCGSEVPQQQRKEAEFINGTYLCVECRRKEEEKNRQPKEKKTPDDVKMNRDQRQEAEKRPAQVIDQLLQDVLGLFKGKKQTMAIQGYTDLKKIGEGGFGAVYKARRVSDGKIVAVKTMLQTRKPPKKQVLMFEREKEIAEQLRHPNIVRANCSAVWNDIHFIEMEFADGGSVWDLMDGGKKRLDLATAAPIMLDALEGLAYAHRAEVSVATKKGKKTLTGVVHRDLKPPNILLTSQGGRRVAKVTDYGLAKAFSAAGMTQAGLTTQAGSFCGTAPYMAPEHISSYKYAKPATDVFEMAATFFHILTGAIVWPVRPGSDIYKVILESRPRRLKDRLSGAPRGLYQAFDQALELDVKKRFQDGQQFLNALKKVL